MTTNGDFKGKIAIVTGASSGFGQATAILLAKKGASIVLFDKDGDRLMSSIDQCIEASGGNASRFTSVIGDVTKPEIRKSVVDKAIDTFQRLDILVACAGVALPEPGAENVTEEVYDKLFDTNTKALFFLIQAALPFLEKSGGNIVSISSISSIFVVEGFLVYQMTKAAVDHMTRCLALDLAPKGIRVNAVNPSFVPTRILRGFGEDVEEITQQCMETESPKNPLYGKCVTVEAIADTIAFLASDAAKFVTGQCHVVDGGRHYTGSAAAQVLKPKNVDH